MSIRYDKYDLRGAVHWHEYNLKTYYKLLVDDSLAPFLDIGGGTVLDAGCGDGVPSCLLSAMGFDVTGVEIEALGIKYAKKYCKANVEWINDSIENFLKENRTFDYLYCLDVMEHLDSPQPIVDLMKNIKKFGVIITDDSEARARKKDKYHVHEFTKKEFKDLFKDYKVEEIELNENLPRMGNHYFAYKIYA